MCQIHASASCWFAVSRIVTNVGQLSSIIISLSGGLLPWSDAMPPPRSKWRAHSTVAVVVSSRRHHQAPKTSTRCCGRVSTTQEALRVDEHRWICALPIARLQVLGAARGVLPPLAHVPANRAGAARSRGALPTIGQSIPVGRFHSGQWCALARQAQSCWRPSPSPHLTQHRAQLALLGPRS